MVGLKKNKQANKTQEVQCVDGPTCGQTPGSRRTDRRTDRWTDAVGSGERAQAAPSPPAARRRRLRLRGALEMVPQGSIRSNPPCAQHRRLVAKPPVGTSRGCPLPGPKHPPAWGQSESRRVLTCSCQRSRVCGEHPQSGGTGRLN